MVRATCHGILSSPLLDWMSTSIMSYITYYCKATLDMTVLVQGIIYVIELRYILLKDFIWIMWMLLEVIVEIWSHVYSAWAKDWNTALQQKWNCSLTSKVASTICRTLTKATSIAAQQHIHVLLRKWYNVIHEPSNLQQRHDHIYSCVKSSQCANTTADHWCSDNQCEIANRMSNA